MPGQPTSERLTGVEAAPVRGEVDTKRAADQLGHATEQVTKKHYIEKPAVAPDSSDILEQLGAGRTTDVHEHPDNGPDRAA